MTFNVPIAGIYYLEKVAAGLHCVKSAPFLQTNR
jgi:hypothetical protein